VGDHDEFYARHPVDNEASDGAALAEQNRDATERFRTLLLAHKHGSTALLGNSNKIPQEHEYLDDDLVFFFN
jgi:hypothetical protein